MNNKIEKKIAMDDFNLSQEMINHDLLKYYNYFNKKQKGILLKRYKSVEDYINILYCFRFFKKLECILKRESGQCLIINIILNPLNNIQEDGNIIPYGLLVG